MSNRAIIQQESITVKGSGEQYFRVKIYDNYEEAGLTIDVQFDDELELLRWVLRQVIDCYDITMKVVATILEPVVTDKGIEIDGVWYYHNEVAPVFEEIGYK